MEGKPEAGTEGEGNGAGRKGEGSLGGRIVAIESWGTTRGTQGVAKRLAGETEPSKGNTGGTGDLTGSVNETTTDSKMGEGES